MFQKGADTMYSDEERSILLFLETHFAQGGMSETLRMLRSPRTKVEDLRAIIEAYRNFYRCQQN